MVIAGIVVYLVIYLQPLYPYFGYALTFAKDLVVTQENVLRTNNGRINFLILGLGEPKNEPSGLTDTIIFASADLKGKDVLLLSIPRDIWVPQMQAKINTAYYYGNSEEGTGLDWTRKYVSEIVGQPIDYEVVVSFDNFREFVNLLGGVDVNVEKSFTDDQYPIFGKEDDLCSGDPETQCRYQTVTFETGLHHFDGETALKYARSRHAQGAEGTDFSRSQRQQKIISAIRGKVLAFDFLSNPTKIGQVLDIVNNAIDTDIPQSHFGPLAKLAFKLKSATIRNQVLETPDQLSLNDGFLDHPKDNQKYNKQWVLVPRGGNWDAAHSWVACLLQNNDCKVGDFTSVKK
ncbi:MAG: Cell envelope-related transcriptional attenuator [Microgenomates group bacterium GW2011_GWA2_39_19]|nr:MAG: Cell envelope-related transcriptional attenuator [Microgenomates group bacterium GW2011_GWA2_39_19]